MPISVLFTIPNFITAGSGRAMLNIVERLDRSRFSPAVCVMRKGGKLDQIVERMGIPFLEAPFTVEAKPYTTLPFRAWRAAQPFRAHRFQVWHSYHYGNDYTEPIIARLAGARGWIYTKKNMNWHQRAWHVRSMLAARIAAQNHDMLRDFFAGRRYARKTRLVPRGVDTVKFSPGTAARMGLRSQLAIPSNAVVVGCVAQLLPVKGHPTLLDAVAQVPRIHLFLAGTALDQDYTEKLHEQAVALKIANRFHFLGGVEDVPAFLSECDIAVLPTWARWRMEGCPVALLEAMACGKACIATDVPGSRDLIVDRVSGLLVPPEDAGALATAITDLAANPERRQQFGQAARTRVETCFTLELETAAHESLYQELIGS